MALPTAVTAKHFALPDLQAAFHSQETVALAETGGGGNHTDVPIPHQHLFLRLRLGKQVT